MTLNYFIDKTTTAVIAQELSTTQDSVRKWRRGVCLPKAEQLLKIEKMTRGSLTCTSMISRYFSNPKNRKKFSKRSRR